MTQMIDEGRAQLIANLQEQAEELAQLNRIALLSPPFVYCELPLLEVNSIYIRGYTDGYLYIVFIDEAQGFAPQQSLEVTQ